MNRETICLMAALALAGSGALAQSQKVYRCEEGGRVTYGDAPCKAAVEIKADDARSEEERKAAREVAQRDKKLAQQLTSERRAREAASGGAAKATHIPHSAAIEAAKEPPAAAAKDKKPRPRKVTRSAPPG